MGYDSANFAQDALDSAESTVSNVNPAKVVPLVEHSVIGHGPVECDSDGILIASEAMRMVFKTAQRLASVVIPVLLVGETGTGKGVVAEMIQRMGDRRDAPMITVNCGAIPSQLVESTLFGHERGAFTGAHRQSKGVFESADGGTVLLDEIGELPIAAQAALLRVLETKRFYRVGSTREVAVDVRVLAATNQNLQEMCAAGTFRKDLLYRLNAVTVQIPPLRERVEEILPFAWHFLKQANRENDCSVRIIDREVIGRLEKYGWPGNVRELKNTIAHAAVISEGSRITTAELPEHLRRNPSEQPPVSPVRERAFNAGPAVDRDADLKTKLQHYEVGLIREALDMTDWNRARAAASLGLPLRTLSYKIQQYGIKKGY